MTARASRRGQPLVMLMLLVGGWVGARVVVWNGHEEKVGIERPAPAAADLKRERLRPADPAVPSAEGPRTVSPIDPPVPYLPEPAPPRIHLLPAPLIHPAMRLAPDQRPLPPAEPVPVPVPTAVGHQVLWMAALANPASPPPAAKPVSIEPGKPPKDDKLPVSDPAPAESAEF